MVTNTVTTELRSSSNSQLPWCQSGGCHRCRRRLERWWQGNFQGRHGVYVAAGRDQSSVAIGLPFIVQCQLRFGLAPQQLTRKRPVAAPSHATFSHHPVACHTISTVRCMLLLTGTRDFCRLEPHRRQGVEYSQDLSGSTLSSLQIGALDIVGKVGLPTRTCRSGRVWSKGKTMAEQPNNSRLLLLPYQLARVWCSFYVYLTLGCEVFDSVSCCLRIPVPCPSHDWNLDRRLTR
ncbi:hypothetical protein N657DRAFT_331073 [Parathielavia appendiculata]|uniref:Uncharacterized protein n=1 Tax=Parathielavia appendiculata TaxID=2587402 RepID=A0AAN6U2S0_9PEZI|nr:hypothetical protein N657DRAFT_331073 [Parathielavia appendiculata]